VLVAWHARAVDVTLRLPAGMLRRVRTTLDVRGDESRSLSTEATTALGDLSLPAGEIVRVPLCSFELPTAGALAVREHWSLTARAGSVLLADEELPAQEPSIAACETTRLASFLPTADVEPAELVAYLHREELYLPALLERAVRIPAARREEALVLLEPVVAELAANRPAHLADASPALRWLARSVDHGREPAAWAAWFAARESARAAERRPGSLDLPEDRNDAR
jgi:hypothetical protein